MIEYNTFENFDYGIFSNSINPSYDNFVVNYNNFINSSTEVAIYCDAGSIPGASLNAEYNWWGANDGPSGAGSAAIFTSV